MKKAVSFILAAIMLIMLPAGAFADSAQCSCDTPPVVMVNGFGTERNSGQTVRYEVNP